MVLIFSVIQSNAMECEHPSISEKNVLLFLRIQKLFPSIQSFIFKPLKLSNFKFEVV